MSDEAATALADAMNHTSSTIHFTTIQDKSVTEAQRALQNMSSLLKSI